MGLLTAAGDPAGGGGGTPLTIGEQIKAAISAKAGLQRELNEAQSTVATLTESLTTAHATAETATAELTKLKAEFATKETAFTTQLEALKTEHSTALAAKDVEITRLKTEATTVKDHLAQLGVPSSQLPPKTPTGTTTLEDKFAALEAEAKATEDPVRRGEIAQEQLTIWRQMSR